MSRNSDYFKKIQLSLFDFLNLSTMDNYKGKDLLGPLKYLDTIQIDQNLKTNNQGEYTTLTKDQKDANSSTEALAEDQNIKENQREFFKNKAGREDFEYDDYLFDLPLIVHRKPYLRHIKFYVKPNSTLHVVAPLNRSLDIIKREISEHKKWIEKCDLSFQKLRSKFPVKYFKTGESFPFLGEVFYLKLEAVDLKKPVIQIDLDQLQYFYPESWDKKPLKEKTAYLKKHLMSFYFEKATLHLNQRLRFLSEHTQLFPKRVSYRNQKTRWGSCTSAGNINLNWKLIAFEPNLIDYVILHELCHLSQPNHSKRFWSLVNSFCTDYKRLDKQLGQVQYEVDFLAPESELYFSNPKLL